MLGAYGRADIRHPVAMADSDDVRPASDGTDSSHPRASHRLGRFVGVFSGLVVLWVIVIALLLGGVAIALWLVAVYIVTECIPPFCFT